MDATLTAVDKTFLALLDEKNSSIFTTLREHTVFSELVSMPHSQ